MLPKIIEYFYKGPVTNEEVRRKIKAAIGKYVELLTLVRKRKVRWFGHVSMYNPVGQNERKRRRGRQKKRLEDNIKEWTGMDFASSARDKVERDCCKFSCGSPTTFEGYGIE